MSGWLPPGVTDRHIDEASPGFWDEPEREEQMPIDFDAQLAEHREEQARRLCDHYWVFDQGRELCCKCGSEKPQTISGHPLDTPFARKILSKYTKIAPQRISPEVWGPPSPEVEKNMEAMLGHRRYGDIDIPNDVRVLRQTLAENERLRQCLKEIARLIVMHLEGQK